MRRRLAALLVVAWAASTARADGPSFTVASKKFTESVVLGEALAALARADGVDAVHQAELGGTRVVFDALVAGQVDAYVEYTGTLRQELLAGAVAATDAAGDDDVRQALRARGVVMLVPLGFNNTYALGLLRPRAQALSVARISDLRAHPTLALGFTNEFLGRKDGWQSVQARYQLPQQNVTGLDHDLAYRGLEQGSLDVVDLYSTDAAIVQRDLVVLEDDLRHFPAYQAVVLVRADALARHGTLQARLSSLSGKISAARMAMANAAVQVSQQSEQQAAAALLQDVVGMQTTVTTSSTAERLWQRTKEHVALVGVSLLLGIAVALPLGIVSARRRRLGQLVLGAAAVLQTIPSLALLVLLIPLLGIGARPAIAALFLYSLLPVVRNTTLGLTQLPRLVHDSADVLGLTAAQKLRRVELPLALPSIVAGIKTAAVINVGTATLGAVIGAGGYGQPILAGIRLADTGLLLEGAVPAALLALLVSSLMDGLERLVVSPGLRL